MPVLKPIALDEQSYNVELMHDALAVLGLPVSTEEVKARTAGRDTLGKVRELQKRLAIIVDEQILVDEATITAATRALAEQGYLNEDNRFLLQGMVRLTNGEPSVQQRLMAFDLDLKAVAQYRSIATLTDLQKREGFEYLGETLSSNQGRYYIEFYDWQYAKAERKKADVVVFAVEGDAIVGVSRLVYAREYSIRGVVEPLDVILRMARSSSEYARLQTLVEAFLRDSEVDFIALRDSAEQLSFISSELDVPANKLHLLALSSKIRDADERLADELLYGIGRRGVRLSWPALQKKSTQNIRDAIIEAVERNIIGAQDEAKIESFIQVLSATSARQSMILDSERPDSVSVMLGHVLREESQRVEFLNALRDFEGEDYQEFWTEYLPSQDNFRENPELVSGLLFVQQMTVLSGNHQKLVEEIVVSRKLSSIQQLFDLEDADWQSMIGRSGVPEFIEGENEAERTANYIATIKSALDAAFPTLRVTKLLDQNAIPLERTRIAECISTFLNDNREFDIAQSRVSDFERQIREVAEDDCPEVSAELMKIQRVFQVSTSPESMIVLMENGLFSAHAIAGIPRNSFVQLYSGKLGGGLQGERLALGIHQRASHISMRSEMGAVHLLEMTQAYLPAAIVDALEKDKINTVLENYLPNYSELFGPPDMCECKHCRSVYSAAAYYVDLLRFLWRGTPNSTGDTPLDIIKTRRPDLIHLPLTCENSNTLIPYIDLANEVMEYYVANNSLASFKGHNTGEASESELRANPQYVNLAAYQKLNAAVYPFSLPFHQPLEEIRTYSKKLNLSRSALMHTLHPQASGAMATAIQAETLALSPEEFQVLVGEDFSGNTIGLPVHEYYGLSASSELATLSMVREFMRRSDVSYSQLVELLQTRFINPHQEKLDFLQTLFTYINQDANTFYTRLQQIESQTLDPATDPEISAGLLAYSDAVGKPLTTQLFQQWVIDHFSEFKQVITLYEPNSLSNLDTTELRTVQSTYENQSVSGLQETDWARLHRFIRLWRKLDCSIAELDLTLTALDIQDMNSEAISRIIGLVQLQEDSKRPLEQLAVLWGDINKRGKKSLYNKLFLNRAVQKIDEAFQPDAIGDLLAGGTALLGDYTTFVTAAFGVSEEELASIYEVAEIIDNGNRRHLDPTTDQLSIANLSTLYRYPVLAKACKVKIPELCQYIKIFGSTPFSLWDIQQQKYVDIRTNLTHQFYQRVLALKENGFTSNVLAYIVSGEDSPIKPVGLQREKVLQTAKLICDTFAAIEREHPENPPVELTQEILATKLGQTFQADVVDRFIGLLTGEAKFSVTTDANLNLVLPQDLLQKYQYIKSNGSLSCRGIMTTTEQTTLKNLANASVNFQQAVDALFARPEDYFVENFSDIFVDQTDAIAILLNRPAQSQPAILAEKLNYIYRQYIPHLKTALRRQTLASQTAALTGLSDETSTILLASELDALVESLSVTGFTADYFNDTSWNNLALQKRDQSIDFSWGMGTPDPLISSDNFSVRWQTWLAAPGSEAYTLIVDVAEADDTFKLYLDGEIVLEKAAADSNLSWEVLVELNSAQLHLLKLEYSETAQNARVRLSWKTPTTARQVIPSLMCYPVDAFDQYRNTALSMHRAAMFIDNNELTAREIRNFLQNAASFENIDFYALTPSDVDWVKQYADLRDALPGGDSSLNEIFRMARTIAPSTTIDDIINKLNESLGWKTDALITLINVHFNFSVADFVNHQPLLVLSRVMAIVNATGISADTLLEWGAIETDFTALADISQRVKKAVKARYQIEDWFDTAAELSNILREKQQYALTRYLLVQPDIRNAGIRDADGLFEYFLIDVQMTACMDTSRVIQASAAVQMFVNRCLLNLESDQSGGSQKGVSPGAIDKQRWEWMKNYRVWEANRKVFLYPENWLEPEWRNDRSEFFRELESWLVEKDITERSVEEGIRNYLGQLNEVANLDVCGMYAEEQDKKLKYLHVFARTLSLPHKYFYRRWNQYQKWSAWESVPIDVTGVENGPFGGVHLMPVIWKNRLLLVWPEFMDYPYKRPEEGQTDSGDINTEQHGIFWKIKLGWSEYRDGKWTPKQLSSDEGEVANWQVEEAKNNKGRISCMAQVNNDGYLEIKLWNNQYLGIVKFTFKDIHGQISIYSPSMKTGPVFEPGQPDNPDDYYPNYSKRSKYHYADLQLLDNLYLKSKKIHSLLFSSERAFPENKLDQPFFYGQGSKSWFVRPVPIKITDSLKRPESFKPFIPQFVDDSGFTIPDIFPDVGPDDYLPGVGALLPEVLPGGSGLSQQFLAGSAVNPGARAGVVLANSESDVLELERDVAGATSQTANLMTTTAISSARGNATAVVSNAELNIASRASNGNSFDLPGDAVVYAKKATGQQISSAQEMAFADSALLQYVNYDTGLEFHTFYHPFAADYVEHLNRGGVPALLARDTEIESDKGVIFESLYDPNFTAGYVKRHTKFASPPVERTAYKENVCFDVFGANSIYNWELFFHAPLFIATRLSQSGKYEAAMRWFHTIFDPTTDALPVSGESEISRFWKLKPFKQTVAENLEAWFKGLSANNNPLVENAMIGEWRDNPFQPHIIASNRPVAYMKNIVIKYVENLIAWGDSLFRQFTRESVYESMQLYVIANHILGPRPEFIPKRGNIKAETFNSLQGKWDDFSNALVQMENMFPYSSEVANAENEPGTSLLGAGPSLYFCVPPNEKLLEYWDMVADRLFKIRHCQDINGVERQLALFAPPIDPAVLVNAVSQGLSIGSILADLSSPPPIYRFSLLLQKANEFCGDVRSLGSMLLSALEKKDAEELAVLRASQETQMLELIQSVRERQVLDAKSFKSQLERTRDTAQFRFNHYMKLLGNQDVSIPGAPTIDANLNSTSQLPADTQIPEIIPDVSEGLVDGIESGVKLIKREKEELEQSEIASDFEDAANVVETIGKALYFIPSLTIASAPWGAGTLQVVVSGTSIGLASSAAASGLRALSAMNMYDANRAGKLAGYIRREQDWTLQANLAAKNIVELDKQITSADIRIQVAEKELENHKQQIIHAEQIETFLADKFTNEELYQWMKERLLSVYKQSYNLAYDMAKKAEKAWQYETNNPTGNFIQFGYWDNSKQGLLAGEQLQLSLRQLEKNWLEENRRELELHKSVSLALLDPLALLQLRETGKCYVRIPEELFDLDFQGHYFRKLKSASLSIPCIAGPYTTVNCSLRLLNNSIRINTSMNSSGEYEHENEEGMLIDDDRFRSSYVPVSAIATSQGQNDAGMFEFNFRDERYLPFEGAGAISEWMIELTQDKALRQFDYDSIADVIIHLNFTARESGGLFKERTVSWLKRYLNNEAEIEDQPLVRMFSMRHEFPTEWQRYLAGNLVNGEQLLSIIIGKQRMPFFVQDRELSIMSIDVFAKPKNSGDYHLVISYNDETDSVTTSNEITMPSNTNFGGLRKATIGANDAGLNLEDARIDKALTLKLKHNSELDYTANQQDEFEDVFIALHYKLM